MENIFLVNENNGKTETAVLEDNRLVEYAEFDDGDVNEGSVIIGRPVEYAKALDAYFVDVGMDKNAYLPQKHIYGTKPGINKAMPFQVLRCARGTKGMTLSCRLMVTGDYTLCGNIARENRVSSKIQGDERKRLLELLSDYAGVGREIIIRTAAAGIDEGSIRNEIEENIERIAYIEKATGKPGEILYKSENRVDALLRRFNTGTDKVYFNNISTFNKYFDKYGRTGGIKHYNKDYDMFDFFNISNKIREARQRKVNLKSGGELVFDYTEAMCVVDVNSARNSDSGDFSKTALQTNLEAADEIAVQLRLRNLGGIIVIDFIETDESSMKEIDEFFRKRLGCDLRRIEIGGFTKLGNYEIIRERKGRRLEIGRQK